MNKIIFIKYGELNTKHKNINFFLDKLYQNVKEKLKDDQVDIYYNVARMYIKLNKDNLELVINKLKQVFGILKIVIAYEIDSDLEVIQKDALKLLETETFNTFKVTTKRADKRFNYSSMEVNCLVGSYLLQNLKNKKVDVHQPNLTLTIEIRSKGTYLYLKEIEGLGGYPVSIQGKALLMLSGGIDSPVAGFLSLKRGVEIECLYFDSPPHTSLEALNKVKSLVKQLSLYTLNIKLHIILFTEIQEAIYKHVDSAYMITIMRRMMYRISNRLATKLKAHALINGESIGQVASQTLTSMKAINRVTNIPIIRPLACFDKLEIIEIAKEIGTYEISILPFEDCCTIFVPTHPVINPEVNKCLSLEKRFDYQKMINDCLKKIKSYDLNDLIDSSNNHLL